MIIQHQNNNPRHGIKEVVKREGMRKNMVRTAERLMS